MIVKEFIYKVADGSYTNNDIIEYATQKEDKMDLLWCLYFSDKAVEESTGKPQINDQAQISRIDKAISLISLKFNISLFNEPTSNQFNLPEELYCERSQALFNKAISDGLITIDGCKLKWNKTKCLLAYFIKRVYLEDDDGKPIDIDLKEKIINQLFNESRLSKAVSQLVDNRDGKPKRGSEIIDRLFKR